MSQKAAQRVEPNRFRVSAGPLQHSKNTQLRVKCKGHASSQRTCGALKFNPCYIFLTQTNICIIHHSYSSNTDIPFKRHLSCYHKETTDSGQHVELVYLQSLNPDVPSGAVGWRITWLFGRTASDVCRVLRWAGLKEKATMACLVSFPESFVYTAYLSCPGLSGGVSSDEALPKILRRASAYSASRWAKDFICWVGRDKDAGFPDVPLFVGRFRILICGGGAAGRESSWITIAVLTGEPPEPRWDFLIV